MSFRTRAAPAALALALAACGEHPPVETVQTGFRGTGMEQVYNPRVLKEKFDSTAAAIPQDLPPLPQAAPGQVAASQQPAGPSPWRNVQVLNDISPGELTRTMVAMTAWVSPEQGCNYCHVVRNGVTDFASDSIYTKVVSRQMLRMTREINGQWRNHVANTGVTCYTCHGGKPVPQNVWYFTDRNQPLRHYLDRQDLRVQSASMTPSNANRSSIKQTEYTYALMISMSRALGVNCTYCHNSPRWGSWEESTPQRLTALRGIRMVRELNNGYLLPLQPVFPAQRLGPHGDVPKIQCATCHNGAYKPLYGRAMAQGYPALYAQAAPPTQAVVPGTGAGPDGVPTIPADTAQRASGDTASAGGARTSLRIIASPHGGGTERGP